MATRGVRVLSDELMFAEAPRWHERRLYVSDFYAKEVVALDLDGGRESIGFVRVAEGGEVKERISSERSAVAVELGGPDGDDIFMVEAMVVGVDRLAEASVVGNGRVLVGKTDVPGAAFA